MYWKKSLFLPKEKDKKGTHQKRRGTWQYFRTGWFDGNLKFENKDGLFSGTYQIEVRGHQHPKIVRLYSDSIEFHLIEEYHTFFQSPSISVNFFDCK